MIDLNRGVVAVFNFLFWFVIFFGLFTILFSPGGVFVLAAIFLVGLAMMPILITAAMVSAILEDE